MPKKEISLVVIGRTIFASTIDKAEQVLMRHGIESDECAEVLRAVGYTLLAAELYPNGFYDPMAERGWQKFGDTKESELKIFVRGCIWRQDIDRTERVLEDNGVDDASETLREIGLALFDIDLYA